MGYETDSTGLIDDLARSDGIPLGQGLKPSLFDGTATGAVKGLARGILGKPALLLGDAVIPTLRPTAKAVDSLFGTQVNSWLSTEQDKNRAAMDAWKPDPMTTGFAGQVVHSLFDLGGSALVFGPAATGVMTGYAHRQDQITSGVDPLTATGTGAVAGTAAFAGLKIPLTLGASAAGKGASTVAANVGFGAGSAVTVGVAEQATLKDILTRAGYKQQADAIDPFDTTSLAAQAALGGLFSGAAAAVHGRATSQGQAAIDAALTITRARHSAIDSAPGIPATASASAAHSQAMEAAGAAILRNEPVNVGELLAGTEFVKRQSDATTLMREEVKAFTGDLSKESSLRDAAAFSPAEAARRDVEMRSPQNLSDLQNAIKSEKNPQSKAILQAEFDKQAALALKHGTEPTASERLAMSQEPRGMTAQLAPEQPRLPGVQRLPGAPMVTGEALTGVIRNVLQSGEVRPMLEPRAQESALSMSEGARVPAEDAQSATNSGADAQAQFVSMVRPVVQQVAQAMEQYTGNRMTAQPGADGTRTGSRPAEAPAVQAAIEVANTRPDMLVTLEDGTRLTAREVMVQAREVRQIAQKESAAFAAAVNCFLRTGL